MPGGRMLLPLTAGNRHGTVFLVERLPEPGCFHVAVASGVSIYPCAGARTEKAERLLCRALGAAGQRLVRSLRLDTHAQDATCWLHGDGYCFSTKAAAN